MERLVNVGWQLVIVEILLGVGDFNTDRGVFG